MVLRRCFLAVSLSALGLSAVSANPADTASADAGPSTAPAGPVVVELFLSQACRACPPAVDILRSVAEDENVIPLSWHVDYWDRMPMKNKGHWRDPYSNAAFTDRQRAYNKRLRGRATVFTPQAVINGVESVVGSKEKKIQKLLSDRSGGGAPAIVRGDAVPPGQIRVNVGDQPHDVIRVTYLREMRTVIPSGANKGLLFDEVNIVTEFETIAEQMTGERTLELSAPTLEEKGCLVLVQAHGQGRIRDAAYC